MVQGCLVSKDCTVFEGADDPLSDWHNETSQRACDQLLRIPTDGTCQGALSGTLVRNYSMRRPRGACNILDTRSLALVAKIAKRQEVTNVPLRTTGTRQEASHGMRPPIWGSRCGLAVIQAPIVQWGV